MGICESRSVNQKEKQNNKKTKAIEIKPQANIPKVKTIQNKEIKVKKSTKKRTTKMTEGSYPSIEDFLNALTN